ncbi:hypothetical protein AB0K11_00435 [Mycobacterium sp. NPDC050551]|uniref:hypothetical protein n=1 Tax=Mycobacterium sp. NPDC050551 TaxID=3155407 RepID=UPI003415520F
MPGEDLLRFVGGPLPYSTGWLLLAAVLAVAVLLWWTAVVLWTLPPERLRRIPVVRDVHRRLTERRFVRSVRAITERHRRHELTAAEAGTELARVVRGFLSVRTGVAAQYLHTGDIARGDLAHAAPLLERIDDVQYNADSDVDVIELGAATEALVTTWD